MDLTTRELKGYSAFIDSTNEAGGILGYERMLCAVIQMMEDDHGYFATKACVDRVMSGKEPIAYSRV